MKYYIPILMIFLFSQFSHAQESYESLWKEVAAAEKKQYTKTARKQVRAIMEKAAAEKNHPQLIKAFLHESKYQLVLEEDAQLQVVEDLKTTIASQEFPVKNILQSILAQVYWQYYTVNRYRFYNRTETAEKSDPNDFRTWDLNTLFKEIHELFDASLANTNQLQQLDLSEYNVILQTQEGSKKYRPTVYDFLAHEALEFYKADDATILKPAYAFTIDDENYLSAAAEFIKLPIQSVDSLSNKLNALQTYQNLLKFHLNDTSPEALIQADLERLEFVYQHATFEEKEAKLLNALKNAKTTNSSHPFAAMYDAKRAEIHRDLGNRYDAKKNVAYKDELKKAVAICNQVINEFPSSKAATRCNYIKSGILQKKFSVQAETYIPIQQASKVLVSYKNVSQLHFKLYSVTRSQYLAFLRTYNVDNTYTFINKLQASQTFSATLPNENDYQNHTTEIAIPPLQNGYHIIVASPQSNIDKKLFATATIQVTNLSLVQQKISQETHFQLTDRTNGKPITNQKITFTYRENYRDGEKTQTLTTDGKGMVTLQGGQTMRNIKAVIKSPNDTAYLGDFYNYNYRNSNDDKIIKRAHIFTDRSIYRPGQIVYFKGILTQHISETTSLLENETVEVALIDSNGQTVKEETFTSNTYGSIKGDYIIPDTGLTGSFMLRVKNTDRTLSTAYFSVEEYKRPKFKPEFTPVTETFAVNDTITVNGKAMAFAGSSISDATVVYTVKRTPRYPTWIFWRRPYINSSGQQITSGENITDASGNFSIQFQAIPDKSVDKELLPVFEYEITAEVTDINGETRTATTIVRVGYHTLSANIVTADMWDATQKKHLINIAAQNLNGEKVAAKGMVTIHKLKAPENVLRTRPWSVPDLPSMNKEKFKEKFPHEAYSEEEAAFQFWKKGEKVFEETYTTGSDSPVAVEKTKRWQPGKYLITFETTDTKGMPVKELEYIDVWNPNSKEVADNKLLQIYTNKPAYKPGETVTLSVASAAKDITVTVIIEKDGQIKQTYMFPISDEKKDINIPVFENDRGGFSVYAFTTVYNSFVSRKQNISVPYPSSELQIETITFRDKLKPGAEETWSFKIKGPKGEKVAAEMLASMYDASLDEFASHAWTFAPLQQKTYFGSLSFTHRHSFDTSYLNLFNSYERTAYQPQSFDQLDWFGFHMGRYNSYVFRGKTMAVAERQSMNMSNVEVVEDEVEEIAAVESESDNAVATDTIAGNSKEENSYEGIIPRTNFNETAFFYPQLQTDADGNISFNFTAPEALTQWKLQLLAHTKELNSSIKTLEAVTQKELMVLPNAPRFLREGDAIVISSKISNLTDKVLNGTAMLQLTDPFTGNDINPALFPRLGKPEQSFTVDANGNTQVSWRLYIPSNIQAVQYTILAKAGNFSDGEQNTLPVLSNRMLVTETLPMWIRSNETKTFTLDKLKNNTSTTLKHHQLTLEMTSNPAWYAVQALPYLMEYPYECSEQTFSRFYANTLASHIANSNPKIKQVFDQWRSSDALLSNLEKNQELKSLLIEETPWVRDALSETEQKKRIALLFDLNRMQNEEMRTLRKLEQMQLPSGGFPWFSGGRDNRFITQHILTGFGHLSKLNVASAKDDDLNEMLQKAINYVDAEFVETYKNIKKYDKDADLSKDHLAQIQLHYLYMRSFFPQYKTSSEVQKIMDYYEGQIARYWQKRTLYSKGMMALIMHRSNKSNTANDILRSLKENSITSDELGMYWKANTASWYWYQAPVETQALMIEAFSEISEDITTVDNLRIWLLKHKQTNRWATTKATAIAVYGLLLQGSDWLSVTDMVDVTVGSQKITPSTLENVKVEAGTGYYKTSWNSEEIQPNMATVTLAKKGNGIAWGGLYWQYFEDLDKITTAETSLKLNKKLFKRTYGDSGEVITQITDSTKLEVGDLIRVRIELRNDRAMEFVHMKDMRAAGLEPINVLSQYKWQDGLGYYESTKDASTNFFFDYLPKGVFVFEYDLRVNNKGEFSNGITTIQSMYAPEFSSHSKGVRIEVE